jgi:tRNA-specific 2-thiouridylase
MRAISLFSGGLDSTLAAKLISSQGIEVIALHADIGFGGIGDKKSYLETMAKQAGATLHIVDIRQRFLDNVLFDPKYGYGKNFNPCIDCHGFMFALAKQMMDELGASFLISGEVLGQRPMSQNKLALKSVVKISQTKDILLRPLSAKLMEPTLPEREGWVDREKLLGIQGRGRTTQLQLAKDFGIVEYESPAGGCLLTDVGFSNRLKEFIQHDSLEVEDIDVLKAGRHIRLPQGAKLVVGRNQEDNEKLETIESTRYDKITQNKTGPLSLLQKGASDADKHLAAQIVATYCRHENETVEVSIANERFSVNALESKACVQPYLVK